MVSEADTREELINPKLIECGWKTGDNVIVRREYPISKGKIIGINARAPKLSADYVLIYKNVKLAVVEAKKSTRSYTDGVAQAKQYAELLNVRFTYATNGTDIYQIDMATGKESQVEKYPTPEELWQMTYSQDNKIFNLLSAIPSKTDGQFELRYYQENAINATIKALSEGKNRILLTLATGTGKTCIAFQIVWKLMQAKWNTKNIGERLPRVLFLADRNILADQAFNAFQAFPLNSLVRITPADIKKNGRVPDAQSIFFTIFQTFMSGEKPYFGQYPKDFFDFIIIDECHRGGANDESNWREILNYFDCAVHLGLTATPRRKDNVDTYKYFGEPVYTYSLKQGINDGFLTPFRVRNLSTNFDEYQYNASDDVDGDIDPEKTYKDNEVFIVDKELERVKKFMDEINQNAKTLVFCATQTHAGLIRDMINQYKTVSQNPNYCVRVTADDGERGEMLLRQFQDTSKTIPTILTTSQKLSTGVDAVQVKNIVLLRPVNSMIEFKQIIGRGTRICEDKDYFTIYDFVGASHNFEDKEWDGPIEYTGKLSGGDGGKKGQEGKGAKGENGKGGETPEPKKITKIKLGKGREVEIFDNGTTFYDKDLGKPISAKEFIERLVGQMPNFFKTEEELRQVWLDPLTRKTLLKRFAERGYNRETFKYIQKVLNAENNDVFDVLSFLAEFCNDMMTRSERADQCKFYVMDNYAARQFAFIEFVLQQYVKEGISELDDERIGQLVNLKYGSPVNASQELGKPDEIRSMFCTFQQYLYKKVA
jgi:type I restriction enzyme R subunit